MRNNSYVSGTALALQIRDAYKTYGSGDSAVTALNGVSLSCPPGTFTAIMGPSGSGKSTLLQCAAGLDKLDSGQITIAGTDISSASDGMLTKLRRSTIGFIFQSYNLIGSLSVEANVALPLKLSGKKTKSRDVRESLARVGMEEFRNRRPRKLSGGQQQRVAIARSLVTSPELLFADEPTGALDSTSAKQVLQSLRQMVDAAGQTILMVTHDPAAASYADQVVLFADGSIVNSLTRPDTAQIAEALAALER